VKNIKSQISIIKKLSKLHNIKLSFEDGVGYCSSSRINNEIIIDRKQIDNTIHKENKKYFERCEYDFDYFILNSFLHELGHQKQRLNWSKEKLEKYRFEVDNLYTLNINYEECYSEKVANRFARRWRKPIIKKTLERE